MRFSKSLSSHKNWNLDHAWCKLSWRKAIWQNVTNFSRNNRRITYSRTSQSTQLWYSSPWLLSRSLPRRVKTRSQSANISKRSNLVLDTPCSSLNNGLTASTTLSRDKSVSVLNGALTISVSIIIGTQIMRLLLDCSSSLLLLGQ